MKKITVRTLEQEEKDQMGIESWSIWEKEISTFPWSYETQEDCYIISGKAKITNTDTGESVEISEDDFVVFAPELKCTWEIIEPIKKYYRFV